MLTPAFELKQDEKYVYVYIKTPYIKISDVDFFIEESQFKFHVKPYFLRLNLPGKVVENGEESASYDVEKGLFTVTLPKMVPGYHFEDLDLLTKLLAPSGQCNISTPGIEVVHSTTNESYNNEEDDEENWEWEQDVYDEKKEHHLDGVKYGFANKRSGVFYRLQDSLKEIVENPKPDELSYSERRIARIVAEQGKFDADHYLADYFDRERIQDSLSYTSLENEVVLTEEEKKKLRQLPNKDYLLDDNEERAVLLSLVDIIFAYAYDHRTTLGENTVESAWTMSTLSPTLSWFERFTNLQDVLVACCRRSLSYPLYRHWQLSCKVIQDVKNIFQAGRRKILKCLVEIQSLFNSCEPRYLLNELYITDYCIWIQKVKENKLESLTKLLSEASITKVDVGLELEELEAAAIIVCDEHSSSESSDESSSSNESCSDTEDETSDEGDDSSEDANIDGASMSEVSDTQNVFGAKLCSEDSNESHVEILPSLLFEKKQVRPLVVVMDEERNDMVKQENVLENERNSEIEILPSLLFERKQVRPLVIVMDEERNDMVKQENVSENDSASPKKGTRTLVEANDKEKNEMVEQENVSENERNSEIEILPSLLFEKKQVRPLVVVMDEERNGMVKQENVSENDSETLRSLKKGRDLVEANDKGQNEMLEQENVLENDSEIKILPSLLFEKKGSRHLIQVIDTEENDDMANCVACSSNTEVCASESSCLDTDVKDTEQQQTELSDKILGISLNE